MMALQNILNVPYTSLPKELKQVWRKLMYRKLENEWFERVSEQDDLRSLKRYIQDFLEFLERDEDYEMCSGIIELMNEYSAVLDK